MPKADIVLKRVLREARQLLGAPALPDERLVETLLDSDERLEGLAERTGLKEKYLRYEMLPLALYPQALRQALALGMPLRQVQRLKRHLEEGKLSPQQLEAALAAPQPSQALRELLIGPGVSFSKEKPVWIYPPDPALRRREALHPSVAETLVKSYSRPGQFVLDPMAGTGTVVRSALQLGRRAEGRDIAPKGAGILKASIDRLPQDYPQPVADLLVLHPPSYTAWRRKAKLPDDEDPYVAYLEYIVQELMKPAVEVLKPGGFLSLIARPRQYLPPGGGAASEAIFVAPFERAIAEFPSDSIREDGSAHPVLLPRAYHLAVAGDGSEHWAIFVAQKVRDEADN